MRSCHHYDGPGSVRFGLVRVRPDFGSFGSVRVGSGSRRLVPLARLAPPRPARLLSKRRLSRGLLCLGSLHAYGKWYGVWRSFQLPAVRSGACFSPSSAYSSLGIVDLLVLSERLGVSLVAPAQNAIEAQAQSRVSVSWRPACSCEIV